MEGIYAVLFLRGILGGWDHPMWTAFTGIGLAAARLTRNTAVKLTAPMGGWLVAVLLHSLHNTLEERLRRARRNTDGRPARRTSNCPSSLTSSIYNPIWR